MTNYVSVLLHCSFFAFTFILSLLCVSADEDRKLYIVYMGSLPKEKYSPSSHHLSLLQEVVESSSIENLLVRSYERSFNGFAAKLTNYEAEKLANMKEVVSVFPSRTLQLQTTRSWNFMGFNKTTSRNPHAESDVIIGVIDSGIWPESESFNDKGFGPPPKKWRGSCRGGKNFTCNNKIIGARYYNSGAPEVDSARDENGHGTHTASTAAGNRVKDASFYGLAQGTAKGGVPSARISAYKVCNDIGCDQADLLAAFDDAIADGVDIITISIGFQNPVIFSEDVIAIGSFHAIDKGILTSQSAGNNGPIPGSVLSAAPWLLSVAASSIDRRIIDRVVLGNGKTFFGNSINTFPLKGTNFPLTYGSNATTNCSAELARSCSSNCLDSRKVKGKIVLCDESDGRFEPVKAGALGSIVLSNGLDDISFVVPSPTTSLVKDDYEAVKSYFYSARKPVGNILKSEELKDSASPVVASFSSRGPNLVLTDILKPDISAPGIDILAAFPPVIPPTSEPTDKRQVKFNIISGTSMSCPHADGVAAYVKSFHPNWSPSAIKSAIMTTAFTMSPTKNPDAELAYGSGHINPSKAIHPGLVYEAYKADNIKLLCSLKGYNESLVRRIAGDDATCPEKKTSPKDLNYPSMASGVPANKPFTIKFHRTVTNVGLANSTYKAKIFTNSQLQVKVVPEVLSFKSINEKKSFDVTVVGKAMSQEQNVSASLVWTDGNHIVRSPISIQTHYIFT